LSASALALMLTTGLVAIVPLAKTLGWSVAVMEASRKAIMLDPAWKNGEYDAPPEQGLRLYRDILSFLAARSPKSTATSSRTRWTSCPGSPRRRRRS
jgi:homoserine acetyltransferase